MFARPKTIVDSRRPPPLTAGASLGACVRCGRDVAPIDRMTGAEVRHWLCDEVVRDGVSRRVEAMRALHRAVLALGQLPAAKEQLERSMLALPDAAGVGEVLDVLSRARVAVECSPQVNVDQRRLALSYLDALEKKLG